MSKRILLAEDELSIRLLVMDILTPQGYSVTEAENGQKAWELLQVESFDLLITDRSMPQMGGLDLLQRLQEARKSIPAIVISAYGEEELWVKALQLGADDYLLKPFKTEDLLQCVQKKIGSAS